MLRYDNISIGKATFDADGFLHDTPIVTRSGIFTYFKADGTKRLEYRPPDEVFNQDSMDSLKGKPMTLKHPTEAVTAQNAKNMTIGSVLSGGRRDGDNMIADIVVYDAQAIKSGKKELSLGYKVDLEETPGVTPEGERYDAVQRNIRYNHLAIVERARAGRQARLNLDGDEIYEDEQNKEGKKRMGKIVLDGGLSYEAPDEVVVAYDKLKKDHDSVAEQVIENNKRIDSLEVELQQAKDANEKKRKDSEQDFSKAVNDRIELIDKAKELKIDHAELSNRQIKEAVIKKVRNDAEMDFSERSDEYVSAMFDLAKDIKVEDGAEKQKRQMNQMKKDGDEVKVSAASARENMLKNMMNGGKA